MMNLEWIYATDDPIWETLAGTILVFLGIIILTRIIGLRSFAKFTTFDFAFTVAIGSIISSILTSSTSIVQGLIAIMGLLILTATFSTLQRKFNLVDEVISNDPLLLMEGENIIEKNMKSARISRNQLIAKLREANVLKMSQVKAVVLETTGDISVLHLMEEEDYELEEVILEGVRREP